MKYIDENEINDLLGYRKDISCGDIERILKKSRELVGLSLQDVSILLNVGDPGLLKKIFEAAAFIKDTIYGKRVVLFAPLYINNFCKNNCVYCSFRTENKNLERKALNMTEIKKEVECLLETGQKRILLVAGEAAPPGTKLIDYYIEAIKTIYDAEYKGNKIKRVNINCAPLSIEEFKILKKSGIGTYQLFQETYHDKTYISVHPNGPKNDPNARLEAIDDAFSAGLDDIGIGVLYGLYDYKFETLALLMHIKHMEKAYGIGPHTISVPRIEYAEGAEFTENIPYKVTDEEFKKIVAILRLAVPYTGIILSTREPKDLRDELLNLGVSQVSAASKTAPGGYDTKNKNTQFITKDHRSLEQMIESILAHGYIPSFCAACYRRERTGKTFMNLAKPGLIKGKCNLNALITLQEYLDDFATPQVKKRGYALIKKERENLTQKEKATLTKFFTQIKKGTRDDFI